MILKLKKNFTRNNDVILQPTTPVGGINPETNFLLKRASKLAEKREEMKDSFLFKLHNGNYAVLTKWKVGVTQDSLVRVSFAKAVEEFKLDRFDR